MRVVAGTAKRLPLKTVPGLETRPTTDRIKETLFNMLQNDIYDCRFLDLFSGSGAIGIEALSRGASFAAFAENNRRAVECIKENLKFTKLEERAQVMPCDAISAIHKLEGQEPFDIVFMDPPYNLEWERRVLEAFTDSSCITEDTLIIVEASKETDFSYLVSIGYIIEKYKEYKSNAHVFIKRAEGRLA